MFEKITGFKTETFETGTEILCENVSGHFSQGKSETLRSESEILQNPNLWLDKQKLVH